MNRRMASMIEKAAPETRDVARLNRYFLPRAPQFMIDSGFWGPAGQVKTRGPLNFDEPVRLLTLLVWHLIPDSDDPVGLLARYRDMLAPESYLVLTHLTDDGEPRGLARVVDEARRSGTDEPTARSYQEVVGMFSGFEPVEPGVVSCAPWRPTGPGDFSPDSAANALIYAGAGGTSASPRLD